MQEAIATLKTKVRKALDDIAPGVSETFEDNVDAEIEQALLQAAEMVVMEAPVHLLEPTIKTTTGSGTGDVAIETKRDGSGTLKLPATAIRLIELQMNGWSMPLTEFLDPASDEAKMQRSSWSCGSPEKPKAVITHSDTGANAGKMSIHYWSINTSETPLSYIAYAEKPSIENTDLFCAVKDILEKNIIYRACQIFLEGKKEAATAEKFAALAQIY